MTTLAHRALAGTALAAVIGACSSSSDRDPSPPPSPPRDPAHCSFEEPPARAPKPAAAPSAVRAGLGAAVLPVPIGAPLGGYAARVPALGGEAVDARPARFVTGMVPTVGIHDAQRAEALALEAGGEVVVVVRMDAPLLNEQSLFELEAAAAPDGSLRGRILLSASHSHAAWAGWQPSLVLMPGVDAPREALARRVVEAAAAAVKDALAALEPARIGIAVDAAFDPGDTVNRDRREDNDALLGPDGNTAGKGKDAVVWALRVDREDGTPMAALVDLPLHGTVSTERNLLASTDVPGAVERALSAELGYPVLHLQGAAGDISPAGSDGRAACPDDFRCLDFPRLEVVGARAAALVAPLVQGIETGGTAALEIVTRTFYIGRNAEVRRPDGTTLRYAPADPAYTPDGILFDESGAIANPIDEFNTDVGAGLCGDPEAGSLAPIPNAQGLGPYSSCLELGRGKDLVFGLFNVPSDVELPLCDTVRATGAALRVSGTPSGDYLLLAIPGEPTAPFAAYLRARSPAGPERTLLVGYADDHVGYVLTAEDWLTGGYEPSINIWGPLEGEEILDGLIEAAAIAWTPELEDPEVGSSRFTGWTYPDRSAIDPMITADHGVAQAGAAGIFWPDTADPAAPVLAPSVPRAVGAARFVWSGGDPAVDMPEVVIEREASPGVFEPLTDARGRAASSRDGVVVVTYAPDPLDAAAPSRHLYAAVWQPAPPDPYSLAAPARPFSLPLGRYRFRVAGAAQAASGPAAYDLASDPFEVVAAPLAASSSAAKNGAAIDVVALLETAPGLRALVDGPSDVGVPLPGPWTAVVTFAGSPAQTVPVTPGPGGAGSIPLTAAEVTDAVSVDVRDEAGNGGTLAL